MKKNRRSFIKKLGVSVAGTFAAPAVFGARKSGPRHTYIELPRPDETTFTANDNIRIACIGTGGMGMGDTDTALMVKGVEVVAACDLYDGRLVRAKEKWGKDIFTSRDYREILQRNDIDAVICATSDHWHEKIAIASMEAKKDVYCEKPMVKHVEEGHRLIQAQKKTGRVFQVGSQYVSSLRHTKAKELLEKGEIGKLNFVEAMFDRHSFRGAWQYSIPLDASEKTVDWKTYVSNTTQRPFDAKRFFRWRNYTDYGTGVAGDLFVHLLSMLHYITGSDGPVAVASSGGLRYFHDGREVPDIQIGMYDYPESSNHPAFNLVLRANFVDGSGGQTLFRLVGDEGEIRVTNNSVILSKHPWPQRPSPSTHSFSEAGQEAFMEWYEKEYPESPRMEAPRSIEFHMPEGYQGDRFYHFQNFFNSIRNGTPVVEDAAFGLRACGPTLAGNQSFAEKRYVGWDPVKMKITEINR